MAKVAEVEGVRIMIYADDHPPPHVHALFAEHAAVIDLDDLTITAGSLPLAKQRKVLAWAKDRRDPLREAFRICVAHGYVEPIE